MARGDGPRDRDPRKTAAEYIKRGLKVVPVPRDAKAPRLSGWPDLRISLEDVPRYFDDDSNIGVLLGDPSGGVLDVDLDTPEAVAMQDLFLPPTGEIFGHPARRRSHRIYICPGALSLKYRLPGDGDMVMESRSTGLLTIFPGSVYAGDKGEKGSPIERDEHGEPALVAWSDLSKALGQLAAACLLVRKWRPGCRDEIATALMGALLSSGWSAEEVECFIDRVAAGAHDEAAVERRQKVRYQEARVKEGRGRVPGWPRLATLIGTEEVACIRAWLGITPTSAPGGRKTKQISAAELGDIMLRQGHYARDAGDGLYEFMDGAYRPGERSVKVVVKRLLCGSLGEPQRWSSHFGEEVVRAMVFDERVPLLWESPSLDTLNLKNGLLDVHTRELRPHDPTFLSPVQLNVSFDPDAKGEHWARYVADWFPGDAQELAWEIAAMLMLPMTHLQKAVYLYNETGANGKSRFIAGLTAFLGEENVSHISLQSLENNRFASSGLMGKLANFYADLPSTKLERSSSFKAITGGDAIEGERKYGTAFSFKPYARLLFSGNGLPESLDASDAFFRRWQVIRFPNRFEESSQKISQQVIDEQLASENEKSWLLNRALDVVGRVIACGLSTPPSVRNEIREFQAATDPVAIWLDLNVVRDPGSFVTCAGLLAAFNQHASDHDAPHQTKQGFGIAVRRHIPEVVVRSRTVSGKPHVKCYIGIGLSAGKF